MEQYLIRPNTAEMASHDREVRLAEFSRQRWNRGKSDSLAKTEGVELTDEHWAVIVFLRKHYLNRGLAKNARSLAGELARQFLTEGGNKYLFKLFSGGPVTQGCRIANLHTPPNAADLSFGTAF